MYVESTKIEELKEKKKQNNHNNSNDNHTKIKPFDEHYNAYSICNVLLDLLDGTYIRIKRTEYTLVEETAHSSRVNVEKKHNEKINEEQGKNVEDKETPVHIKIYISAILQPNEFTILSNQMGSTSKARHSIFFNFPFRFLYFFFFFSFSFST